MSKASHNQLKYYYNTSKQHKMLAPSNYFPNKTNKLGRLQTVFAIYFCHATLSLLKIIIVFYALFSPYTSKKFNFLLNYRATIISDPIINR